MKKACIAIGVDEVLDVAKLAKLKAAAEGAEDFATWAKKSDPRFETQCVTDRNGPVTIKPIKKLINEIVSSKSYDQLIVFFAGHGILKGWDTELWLLSDAASDADEAVNLVGSILYARYSGIPHVLFVSDACRSVTADSRLGRVNGGILFPISTLTRQKAPEIDTFYASLPGDPAYELPADEATKKYDGVFTKYILEGMKGQDSALCETVDEGSHLVSVVSSRTLKPWLEERVQEAVQTASIQLNQIPELRVESQRPKYLTRSSPLSIADGTRFRASTPGPLAPAPTPLTSDTKLRTAAEDNGLAEFFVRGDEIAPKLISERRPSTAFNRDMDSLLDARGRDSFETRTGFTISGCRVARFSINGREEGGDVFDENEAQHIRVYEGPQPKSVLIEFANGTGTCLAALPGYIGSVVVENDRVVNVSYTPARNSHYWWEYDHVRDDLEKRRAFTAVAARRGIFKIEEENAARFASYIRQLKAIDPTLGIYAAYAYAQSGLSKDVKSVFQWMREERGVPVPFDVALLAGEIVHRKSRPAVTYAPRTPMLTQGWFLLHEKLKIPKWLLTARQYTLPSLWTTFNPEGVNFVEKMLRRRF